MSYTHSTPSYAFDYADAVRFIKNREQVYITDENGVNEAVLISAEEYEKLKKALWEHYVDEKLAEAEEDVKKPDAKLYT